MYSCHRELRTVLSDMVAKLRHEVLTPSCVDYFGTPG